MSKKTKKKQSQVPTLLNLAQKFRKIARKNHQVRLNKVMSNKEMLNKERLKRRLNENNIVFDIIIDKMKEKSRANLSLEDVMETFH